MTARYAVDPDVTLAHTLPGRFYHDETVWQLTGERVFARSWQWLGSLDDVSEAGSLAPCDLLPGFFGEAGEPLLLSRDKSGVLRCLSNVCTHRGNLLVKTPCRADQIRCGYHSRRFDLAGRMTFMPEFGAARNFPSPADHLPQIPFGEWAGQGYASLNPAASLEEFLAPMRSRLSWLPLEKFVANSTRSRDYDIHANWALYVENYLEGFHIPFVHAGLNQAVDYGSYRSELHRYANLQLAEARDGEMAFDLPPGSPDFGTRIAAYYWWVFPNLMFNFYPWGLSLNVVLPQAIDRTRVLFRSFVWDESKLDAGAGAALHQVEMEDEAIVEAVQRGTHSRLYDRGRYSPAREQGTHHFHRLLTEFLYPANGALSAGAMMEAGES
ncbi:MAG: aromatic ring-hydroxylating dioxygenase subunit alpha [Betaproteobacteria bacterium]|nr:aromatic ring-hydroxylating dioxygenase subunit alpha [Betaproteobacteria bacterium]